MNFLNMQGTVEKKKMECSGIYYNTRVQMGKQWQPSTLKKEVTLTVFWASKVKWLMVHLILLSLSFCPKPALI